MGYLPNLVQTSALLSEKIYLKESEFINFCKENKLNILSVNLKDNNRAQYAIVLKNVVNFNEKDMFIVFRGTDGIKDWMTNVLINQSSMSSNIVFPKIPQIHSGFLDIYNTVSEEIKKHTWFHNENDVYRIVFCGHSLGGALSQIGYFKQGFVSHHDVFCVTFGSPRVGDFVFAKRLESVCGKNLYRFTSNDIVTRVPYLMGKYVHAGIEYYLTHNGKILRKRPLWFRLYNQIMERFIRVGFFAGIKNHYMSEYLKKINKFFEQNGN